MSLQVIGAGFGRTGTLSLKFALEKLGVGPCYHMMEVFGKADHIAAWADATADRPVDWDGLFEGYNSAVDWPACSFWRELSERYPEGKVLLSLRDPERWYESVSNTIYQAMMAPAWGEDDVQRAHHKMARELILERTFGGRFEDKEHAIAVYNRHNDEVKASVPPERLLVFEAAQGWEPLCAFLGLPMPDEPFPRVNTTDEFRAARLARPPAAAK